MKCKIYDYDVKFVDDFSEGLAYFICWDERHGHDLGFYDRNYNVTINPIYKKAKAFFVS